MRLKSNMVSYLAKLFAPVIGLACLDVVDAAAAGAATLKAATATVAASVTLTASDFISGGKTALLSCPRQIQFTTAGSTASDAPATAAITGLTLAGLVTETVTLAQTATTAVSAYFYTRIDSIVYPAADGTGATIAIGFTGALGLPAKAKGRGASSAVFAALREFISGSSTIPVVQSGTATLAAGTVSVTGVILASGSRIVATVKDPGAGAITALACLSVPVADRNTSAGSFTINALDDSKAVLTTAICTVDYVIVSGSSTTGTLTSPATHKPYGSFTPALVPDASRDYLLFYESEPSA